MTHFVHKLAQNVLCCGYRTALGNCRIKNGELDPFCCPCAPLELFRTTGLTQGFPDTIKPPYTAVFAVYGSSGAILFRHVFVHLAQGILEALDNKGIEGQIVVISNTVQLFHHVGRKPKGFCYGAVIAACNMKRHSFTSFPGAERAGFSDGCILPKHWRDTFF